MQRGVVPNRLSMAWKDSNKVAPWSLGRCGEHSCAAQLAIDRFVDIRPRQVSPFRPRTGFRINRQNVGAAGAAAMVHEVSTVGDQAAKLGSSSFLTLRA
jgi:hypothetical protein